MHICFGWIFYEFGHMRASSAQHVFRSTWVPVTLVAHTVKYYFRCFVCSEVVHGTKSLTTTAIELNQFLPNQSNYFVN